MKRKQLLALTVVGTLLFGVTSATSSYIHEQDGTISICDPNDSTKCITMMDRNLGAENNNINSTGSYGYHYQWGNNYGFEIGCWTNDCSDTVTSGAVTTKAPWNNSYNNYGYNGGITNFMKGSSDYRENNSRYDGLRGGENDTQENNYGYDEINNVARNVENRRGPCGEGYHVPSIGEWNQVLEYWIDYYTGEGNELVVSSNKGLSFFYSKFNSEEVTLAATTRLQEDFKIPFAGSRSYSTVKVYGVGSRAHLWSSSPRVGEDFTRGFYLSPSEVNAYYDINRANGLSVRCFKNSYLSFPPLVSTINESTTTTIGGNTLDGLPETMTVTENTISTAEGKEVLGEVNVDFGSNQTATFSHPVQVKIPVSDYDQVYVKVKHGGDTTYGFAGLTRNSSASCNNGEPTSNQYNGETINVVDGYATIYSCAASSFIALGLDNGGDSEIVVNIGKFNNGQNTCTGQDFIFADIVASPTTITRNLVKTFQCAFGEMGQKAVTLQLQGDLTDGSGNVISSGNVKIKNSAWVGTPAGVKGNAVSTDSYTSLSNTITLFNKAGNIIGIAEGTGVDIQIEIPGGTPDGTYNGVLILSY